VTHAAAAKAELERKRQASAAIAGLGGRCTMVDSHYTVPVVDGDDVVRVVKALGVDHIALLAAADITEDIVMKLPRTKGFAEKLARPAGDVEMLIGMDNQGWMPMHVESSWFENDNLRLMRSVLSPSCILMGSVRVPEHSGECHQHACGYQAARWEEVRISATEQLAGHDDHDAAHVGGAAGVRVVSCL
jgi:hypothetical protein